MSYLFGFSGRINRAKIWLFLLIAIVAEIAAAVVAAFAFEWKGFLRSVKTAAENTAPLHSIDPGQLAWPSIAGPQAMAGLAIIALIVVALIIASFAIYTKRLHDRDKSAWWLLPYIGLPIVLELYGLSTAGYWCAPMSDMSLPGRIAYGVGLLISLWVFVELFFFRGTKGDNRFGPDPLA